MKSRLIQETIFVTIANIVIAVLINLLAWQFRLVSGGLTGYALILNFLTDFPIGVILLIANIILLLIALVVVGKGVGARAIYGFVSFSILIDLTRYLLDLQQTPSSSFLQGLLLIIILSISMGTMVSVVLAINYSVGAYSTVFVIVERFVKIPAQNLFFLLDFILAIVTSFIFGWEKGVLLFVNAIVTYYVVKLVLPRAKKLFGGFELFK